MSENPSAFPGYTPAASWWPGMTLRDWFAGQALPRVIQSDDIPVWAGNEQFAAERAYAFADAMLLARSKETDNG